MEVSNGCLLADTRQTEGREISPTNRTDFKINARLMHAFTKHILAIGKLTKKRIRK